MTSPRSSVVDEVCNRIVLMIRNRELLPGQRLVIPDLARRTGASVGPVREAIRKLSGAGVLDFNLNKGARVRTLTHQAARDLYDVRAVLEGLAAARAAARIDIGDNRERFEAALASVRDTTADSVERYIAANRHFHHLIAEISDNQHIIETLDQFSVFVDAVREPVLLGDSHLAQSRWEHEAIAEAILQGDPLRADMAMRAHIRHYNDLFLEMLAVRNEKEKAREK